MSPYATSLIDSCDGLLEVQWPWYELEAKRVLVASQHLVPQSNDDETEQRV